MILRKLAAFCGVIRLRRNRLLYLLNSDELVGYLTIIHGRTVCFRLSDDISNHPAQRHYRLYAPS